MTRIMYDSVTARDIPASAGMVAGYVDGIYAWTTADWALHANATQVRITAVDAILDANVADIENGALSADNGAAWVKAKLARGEAAYLYFSLSRLAEIQAALSRAGLDVYHSYGAWFGQWDGKAVLPAGWLMKQYANPAYSGGHFDLSIVADYLPGIDLAPFSPPAPPVTPPPTPNPSPTPVDASSAGLNFWSFWAEVVGRGLPRLLGSVINEINNLRGV